MYFTADLLQSAVSSPRLAAPRGSQLVEYKLTLGRRFITVDVDVFVFPLAKEAVWKMSARSGVSMEPGF